MAHRFYNKSNKTIVIGGRRFAPGAIIDYKPDILPPVILNCLKEGTLEEASKTIKTKSAAVAISATVVSKSPEVPTVDEPKAAELTENKLTGKGKK